MANRAERFEPYEVRLISQALHTAEKWRDLAMFTLGIYTGYRITELLSLDVGDVVSGDGTFRRKVTVEHTKNGNARTVALNSAAREALELYLQERPAAKPDEPLFVSQHGGRLGRKAAWCRVKVWCELVPLPSHRRSPHSMRKTFGWAIYKRAGIRAAQVALDHSSVTITERYLGVAQEEVDELVEGMDIIGDGS